MNSRADAPIFGVSVLATVVAAAWLACTAPQHAFGQAEDESDSVGGVSLDNTITGRDYALRLSSEVQFTDEDKALLSDDVAYKQFPTRMYAAEAKLSLKSGYMFSGMYDTWRNPQGLDIGRWALTGRFPLDSGWRLTWMMRRYDGDDDSYRDYHYLALSKSFKSGIYAYLQYRYGNENGSNDTHQALAYLTWQPISAVRVGGQLALTEDFSDRDAGYVMGKLFVSFYAWENRTSIRLLSQHYQGESGFNYQEYETSLYQRLDSRSFVRMDLRYYVDSSDLASVSWGVKLQRYFTTRFSANIGYRSYQHNAGPDFDSVLGGAEVLF